MSSKVTDSKPSNFQDVRQVDVEFEFGKAKEMATCCLCCMLPLSTMGIGCLVLPCCIYGLNKGIDAQQCIISEKDIRYKGGWLNKVDMVLPLEKVQDVVISQDCISRCFGIQNITFQNGVQGRDGRSGGIALGAVKNVEMLRDFVITKRDALAKPATVFVSQPVAALAPRNTLDEEVARLRAQVAALEAEKQQREIEALRAQVAQLQAEKK